MDEEFKVEEVAIARYMRISRLLEELVSLTLGVPDKEREAFNAWVKARIEATSKPSDK